MIVDQRANYRVSFFLGGDIYATPDGDRVGRAIIRDVSMSGMRIETLSTFKEGQTIYLDFEVAGRFQFEKVPAMVVRLFKSTGSYLMGLTFEEGRDRRRLRQALVFALENAV